MGIRSNRDQSPSASEVRLALATRGVFTTLGRPGQGRGIIELKVAEACSHYFQERRGELSVTPEMRALQDLAAANRATARQVKRAHPRVAARLQEFAEMAEGAITRAGRRGDPAARDTGPLDSLIAGLFVVAWHTTDLVRAEILSRFVPPILRALRDAWPDDLPAGALLAPGRRFRRHLSGTLRWINTSVRKRRAPYTDRDLIRHWEHLAFTDDDRFPADLFGHRKRSRPARKRSRVRA